MPRRHSTHRRRRYFGRTRMHARHGPHGIGIGTAISLGVGVAAPIAGIGSGSYNIPSELGSMMRGEKSWGELPGQLVQNTKDGIPLIAAGIAAPLIGRIVCRAFGIGNPTLGHIGRKPLRVW